MYLSNFVSILVYFLLSVLHRTLAQDDMSTSSPDTRASQSNGSDLSEILHDSNVTGTVQSRTGEQTESDVFESNSTDFSPFVTHSFSRSNSVTVAEESRTTSMIARVDLAHGSAPPDYARFCPGGVACEELSGECIDCDFNNSCLYGQNVSTTCRAKPHVDCISSSHSRGNFTKWFNCRYCYQTPHWLHICTRNTSCRVLHAPRQMFEANCSVREDVICLGRRRFPKLLPCNWTSGKRWSVALILSVTLGGFGADRFYLGLWREGIGKLFSFGGLGVWTLVDVVLIATGYVTPADGSLYIY